MNLPLLPTDNLYKFMSLALVVIIIISVSYPIIQIEQLQHRIVSLNGDQKILNREVELLKKEINLFEKNKNKTMAELIDFYRKTNQQQIKNIELMVKVQDIELTSKYISQNRILGIIGTSLGSFLAFFGFSLWYVRIQKLQDLLLKRQVTSDKEIKI